jgi:hypothetical protein
MKLRLSRQATRPGRHRPRPRVLHLGFAALVALGVAASGSPVTAAPDDAVRLVGHVDINPTFNHGVAVHDGIAYLGSFRSDPACPSKGVTAVDVSNPARPVRLPRPLGQHDATNNEQTRVITAHTASFQGDLLVTTLENCWWFGDGTTEWGSAGLQFYDVSHPLHPVELGRFTGKGVWLGFGDVALFQRGSRVYAVGAQSHAEVDTGVCQERTCDFSVYHPERVEGEVVVVDATDPRHPVKVSDWGAGKDGGLAFGYGFPGLPAPIGCQSPSATPSPCRGNSPVAFAHTVNVNKEGTRAYVGYQDDGLIILDIEDPAHPRLLAQTPQDLGQEGNTHIGVPTADERITVSSTEIYAPLFGGEQPPLPNVWGSAQIFDTSDLRHPVQIGSFATPHSASPAVPPGCTPDAFGVTTYCGYSAHQQLISGRTAYFAWYNDGLRVVDISRPRAPREIAHYAPENVDYIWIAKAGNLIFAADVNRGLDVLAVPGEN